MLGYSCPSKMEGERLLTEVLLFMWRWVERERRQEEREKEACYLIESLEKHELD